MLESIKKELQLLTGVVSDDIEYLVFRLIRDSEEVSKPKEEEEPKENHFLDGTDLSNWFDSL